MILNLPNEIWMIIFQFLSFKDFFNFKFLSRRSNEIFFFGKEKLFFLINNAKKIFNVDNYDRKFQSLFIEELPNELKGNFKFSKNLFLKYSLRELANEMCISNVLFHLFYCRRSVFSKNDCLKCSRIFLKKDFELRFSFIEEINLNFFLDDFNEDNFVFNVFWNNEQQKKVINSDIGRCLNSVIVQKHEKFLFLILEIQFAIFCNFFYTISKTFLKERNERIFFLKKSFEYVEGFIIIFLKNVKLNEINEMFEEVNFDQFHYLKVINKKYKEEFKERYED